MNRFQAISSSEIAGLRHASAERFADLFLGEAVAQLREIGGEEALDNLRGRISKVAASRSPEDSNQDQRLVELAMEELERIIQMVRDGHSSLRGWTEKGTASVEERKP